MMYMMLLYVCNPKMCSLNESGTVPILGGPVNVYLEYNMSWCKLLKMAIIIENALYTSNINAQKIE